MSPPDATAVQRHILNIFSSRATASDFQCWKYIYPSLKLLRRRGERSSQLLSNDRLQESFGKKEKTSGVFHEF